MTQDDALFALSTVRETLLFAARLRLPKTTGDKALAERVDAVIRELGLVKVRDTVVGSDKIRGVSGGERKRVNIGIELLHDPKLVFMDEPTSGLDAFQAQSVMETLQALSARGRTVIASIHQPRSSIYAMLHSLVLLSAGRTMYTGPAGDGAARFFANAGVPVPLGFNPADHYLDVISVDLRSDEAAERTGKVVAKLRRRFAEHAAAADDGFKLGAVDNHDDASAKAKNGAGDEGLARHTEPSFCTAFWLLLERSWREQTRDKFTLAIKYSMNTFFCLMFGLVYFQMPRDQTSIQNRTGILFFTAMNQAFGSSIGISQIIPLQLRVVSRERAARLYHAVPYYAATFTTCLPLELIPQFVYSILIYFLAGLRPGWEHVLTYIGIMMLENFVAIGLGMALSGSFKDVSMASQIAPAVVVLFLMFSGFFLNEDSIPAVLGWLKYISFIRYAFTALCINEFKGATFDCTGGPPAGVVGSNVTTPAAAGGPPCLTGDQVLDQLNFTSVTIGQNALALIIELVVFHVLALGILIRARPQFLSFLHQGGEEGANGKKLDAEEEDRQVGVVAVV